jgi:hypothetical protein
MLGCRPRFSSPGRKQQSNAALFAAPVQLTVGRRIGDVNPVVQSQTSWRET